MVEKQDDEPEVTAQDLDDWWDAILFGAVVDLVRPKGRAKQKQVYEGRRGRGK